MTLSLDTSLYNWLRRGVVVSYYNKNNDDKSKKEVAMIVFLDDNKLFHRLEKPLQYAQG